MKGKKHKLTHLCLNIFESQQQKKKKKEKKVEKKGRIILYLYIL